MSRQLLILLRDRGAFDPAPRHSELHDVHVPFDELLDGHGCERALLEGLRRGERIALVGHSGAGKSSVIAATLGPLVEGIFPLPVPVAVERADVARDAGEFVRHVVRTMSRMLQEQLPALGRRARRIEDTADVPGERVSRLRLSAGLPLPSGLRPELAYELQRAAREPAPTSAQVLDQGRELLALISDDGLTPILVLDDTDRWLSAFRTDSDTVRREFFTTIPRLLAEELAAAAVVAVHPSYLQEPAYKAARGFLSTTIAVPAVPGPGGVARILARRIEVSLIEASRDAATSPVPHDEYPDPQRLVDAAFTPAAVELLYSHYALGPSDLRRNVLLIAHTALSLALDDDAAQIEHGHIELAITS